MRGARELAIGAAAHEGVDATTLRHRAAALIPSA
jgi:hypothetical protein